ncbi:hypothetical protein OCS_06750 [Ophiocordyceps sinensis CO18]|nr:hypothetical protein OCS_06750 [Ophiocordyceps sinensis CO18]
MSTTDLTRGIEACDNKEEEAQPRSGSGVSLAGMVLGSTSPVGTPVFAPNHDFTVDESDWSKSPWLPTVPWETAMADQLLPASPEGEYPLVPPSSTSAQPSSPLLPLEAYLMDKNDHERRLLRFSGCPSIALDPSRIDLGPEPECSGRWSRGRDTDELSEPLSSSWDYVEHDDEPKQGTQDMAGAGYKTKVEDTRVADCGSDGHREPGRWAPADKHHPASLPSAASSSPPDAKASLVPDVGVDAPLAARHTALHRELQQAGLGGLRASIHGRHGFHR